MKRYCIQCRVVFSMLFVFSLLLSPSLLAQSAGDGQSPLSLLFSPIQNSPNDFPSAAKQSRKFEGKKQSRNLAKKRNKRHRRMHLNSSMLQGVERFSINLFDDTIVEVLVKRVKQNKRGRTLWRGRIVSKTVYGVKQLARGNVTFVINKGSITGSVRLDGDLYEIQYEANGIHLIKEIETSEFPSDHPVILSPDSLSIDPTTSQSLASAVPALADTEIKVLVLYTQAVAAQTSDIASLVDLAIDETNQSFLNSELSQVLQISLTSVVEVDYTETTYSEMITSLSANSDGVLDEIHELRIQEEADIVVLLAAQNDYCGIGYLNAQYDRAFAVVNYTCATGNYSFAHELGHLAGARHNIENDSTLTPFAYGHGFQSPSQTFRTIMAYNCELSNCPRVDYWSNPLLEYSSEYMGEFEVSNNARVWDETATRLATLHESYIPPNIDRELWFFDIGDYVYTSPIVDENNNVYFAGRDATIYSLNSDMAVNWQQTVSQGITPSLVLENNTIYYRTSGAGDREYGALNATDGQPLWSHVVTGNGNSPAVTVDGISYATDGALLKSFAATGEEIDSVLVTYTAYAAPVIAEDGTVYLALSNGGLRAFSADLSSLWTYQLPTSFGRTCMAIGLDGTIYVPTVDGVLYAVDNSGSLLWEYAFDTRNYDRCPAIDLQNNIIIGSSSGVVLAISAAGDLVWQSLALGSQITSTATIADNGDILIASLSRINALSASGTLLWSSRLNLNNQSSVAIADNGVAYIGDAMLGDGGLRAFNLSGQKLADTAWPRRHGNAKGSSRFERPENRTPIVVIDAPSDGANFLYSDGPFVLQASASDYEDGDLSAMVAWSSDIDGAITSPASLSIGLHNITASVLDSSLVSGSDSVLVNVSGSQNQSPAIEINSPLNNAVISEGSNPLTFVVNANDAEDGDLTSSVILSSNIDGIIQSPAILSVGLHQITASVTDSDEATSSSIISLEITAHINIEPQVNIVSPASGSSISEDDNPVTFVVNASDTEDGDLTSSVILTSSIDGIIQSSAILSVGQHQITASVTDSDGASSTSNVALEVVAHINIAPQVNIVSPVSGSSASEDDNPVVFIVNASDVEDGDLTSSIILSSNIDGIIQSPAALSVGQHQIAASVTDSDGASSTSNITLEITAHINIAPQVNIVSPIDGASFVQGSDVVFNATANDAEDGDLTSSIAWSSDRDGPLGSGGSFSLATLSVGAHTLTAGVSDSASQQVSASVVLTVVDYLASDNDGDGLTNGEELSLGTNPDLGDTDGDGLGDGYEVLNALNPLVDDAGSDADSDGFSNLEEFQAGTDPQDPASYPGAPTALLNSDLVISTGTGSYVENDNSYVLTTDAVSIEYDEDFYYVYEPVSGDVDVRVQVAGMTGDGFTRVGLMIRDGLALDSRYVFASIRNGSGSGIFWVDEPGAVRSEINEWNGWFVGVPYWLRLERIGDVITSYRSPDGILWDEINSVTVVLGSDTYIGLAVMGNNGYADATGTFGQLSFAGGAPTPTPTPVNTAPTVVISDGSGTIVLGDTLNLSANANDIEDGDLTANVVWSDGTNSATGASFSFTPSTTGDYVITATVTDTEGESTTVSHNVTVGGAGEPEAILNSNLVISTGTGSFVEDNNNYVLTTDTVSIEYEEDFYYVYEPVSGDVDVRVQVTGITGDSFTKAGLMIRDGLAQDDRYVFTRMRNGSGSGVSWVDEPGGARSEVNEWNGWQVDVPYWIRLERIGDVITSYRSPDGILWDEINSVTVVLGSDTYIGLAVMGNNGYADATATFNQLSLE